MAMRPSIEKEGPYDVLINVDNELLFCLRARTGAPAGSRLLYAGGDKAVLIRDPKRSVVLEYLPEGTKKALGDAGRVLIAEIEDRNLRYEYFARVTRMKELPL